MLHRASDHPSATSTMRRLRRLWLPLAVAALVVIAMLVPTGSGAAGALLSQGRPADAQSTYSGYRPAAANDGSLSTRWMAASGAYPQRWTVDLGASKRLGLVTVNWQRANNRVYGYRIVASNDREDWTVLADRRANSTIGTTSDAVSGSYRYVRVKTVSSTYGWAQIYEVRVYAAGTFAPPATPRATAPTLAPTPMPTTTPTMSPAPTPMPTTTLTFAPAPAPTPTSIPTPTTTPITTPGMSISVVGTTATAIDTAVNAAKVIGAGTTVLFPAGRYSHGSLVWPDGINLKGAGIGKTQLDFAVRFGSNERIEEATFGSTSSATTFRFTNGAHDTAFISCRFRSRGVELWDPVDYTALWSGAAQRNYGNFHDITWTLCEFESTGQSAGRTFNIWYDSRAGGGSIYNLTWDRSAFGVKNSSGSFGAGQVHFLIQPSPPEHAPDGPRPPGPNDSGGINSTNFAFDFAPVTHGSWGFRMTGNDFVGPASFTSLDICDYQRAWAMVKYRLTEPGAVTQAMRDAAPDSMTTKGWYLADNWASRQIRWENGRAVTMTGNLASQGTTTYHVSDAVRAHDAELYGVTP